jgi:hypothetical protein
VLNANKLRGYIANDTGNGAGLFEKGLLLDGWACPLGRAIRGFASLRCCALNPSYPSRGEQQKS